MGAAIFFSKLSLKIVLCNGALHHTAERDEERIGRGLPSVPVVDLAWRVQSSTGYQSTQAVE